MLTRYMKLIRRAGLIAAAGLASLGGAPALAGDRALIVAVTEHIYAPSANLAGPANDIPLMRDVLERGYGYRPDEIRVLHGRAATREGILEAIRTDLIAGTRAGDRVFMYFSGHGTQIPTLSPDEPTGMDEAFVPADFRPTQGVPLNLIRDKEMAELLAQLEGRIVTVVIDTCHSGTATRSLSAVTLEESIASGARFLPWVQGDMENFHTASRSVRLTRSDGFIPRMDHVTAWSASSALQLTYDDVVRPPGSTHGAFTRRFAEGVLNAAADLNGDGVITHGEMLTYLRRSMAQFCDETGACTRAPGRVTPYLEGPPVELTRDIRLRGPRPPAGASASTTLTDALEPPQASQTLRLTLSPGSRFQVGDRLTITVNAPRGGQLVVLDVRDSGDIIQLYPSTCERPREPGRDLAPGRPRMIPDLYSGCAFIASEPGQGEIVAIVTRDTLELNRLFSAHRDLTVVAEPAAYVGELGAALGAVWAGDVADGGDLRPVDWAIARQRYVIEPRP
jgi:hypothetical protein